MAGKCNHEESRLACTECGAPICSNCLVQCPVGFRCKTCVGVVDKPPPTTAKLSVAKVLMIFAVAGFAGGWMIPFASMIPFISPIICFFVGMLAGNWLVRVIDPHMPKVGTIVVFGLLIGMSLSPMGALPYMWLEVLKTSATTHGSTIFDGLSAILGSIFDPIGFIVGVLRATIWSRMY